MPREPQIGDEVTYTLRPEFGVGIIRTDETNHGYINHFGVEFPVLADIDGMGHYLNANISTRAGYFCLKDEIILLKTRKYTHKKCQGLIVCRSCRKKEMEF